MQRRLVVCLLALFLIAACQPRIKPDIGDGETRAERLLARLYHRNQTLKTFKGIGNIRIWNAGGFQSARIAWLGSMEGRLRVEILGPAGRPLMKMAYDGNCFSYYSMDTQSVSRHRLSNPSLDRVIDVPVTIQELVFYLAGRFPVYAHSEVEMRRPDAAAGDQLILRRFWRGMVEKITLSPDHQSVSAVRIYDGGKPAYTAQLSDYRQVEGFAVPGRIAFTNGGAAGFVIQMHRYWPNVSVEDQQFVISPA